MLQLLPQLIFPLISQLHKTAMTAVASCTACDRLSLRIVQEKDEK